MAPTASWTIHARGSEKHLPLCGAPYEATGQYTWPGELVHYIVADSLGNWAKDKVCRDCLLVLTLAGETTDD